MQNNRKLAMVLAGLFVSCGSVIAQTQQPGQVVPARAELSPLDQPIAWLQEAKRNMGAVKDYKCTLVSQERVKGELLPQATIDFRMKTEPFSVSMRWLAPDKSRGQEVYYVEGKNQNKMRVKSPIFPNVVGFVSVDVNDPRVLQNSRHTIREAGLGNMIDQNLKHWTTARPLGQTKVSVADYKYNNRDCIRLEVSALTPQASSYCCRSIIYLEKESKIPMRIENYDWPRQGGTPGGDLIESFSYVNLQFNVGLKDADFNK